MRILPGQRKSERLQLQMNRGGRRVLEQEPGVEAANGFSSARGEGREKLGDLA